ncbi:pyrroline-5-carboxylate reductase [Nitritalea halalkaliphila LW7]|uniref:Pyrroline-5-carboxylate reductase n=1 Tax=Nitritalea halalkaliphila LW7 TaxID=1189621 RepID=I5C957_9BACT|nr:pyrroline-5-carboxylate reductase [Nitritalea halalkaliphila]EIM78359.1 pyrroline-5-carboxylate reductase [Nitritalea halalkaliphila LW7]
MIDTVKIGIIGCGNLGKAIARGLLEQPGFLPGNLQVTRRNTEALRDLADLGVAVHTDNVQLAREVDVLILGVKPFNIDKIMRQIAPVLEADRQLLLSLATGITLEALYAHVPEQMAVYRVMPNIAADIQESVTCFCSRHQDPKQDALVRALMNGVGESIQIDEPLMEAATVLGACGIAYVLRFMRAMIQGGIQIGFDAKTAAKIVNQTVKGAAELMIQQDLHPEAAIDKVTTPKGCTIVGLNEMEHQGFSSALVRGVLASYKDIEKK